VTFDAFFEDTMFHEVAHGLGIKKTLDGKGTVDEALKEYSSSFEEGKADILGLYMIDALSAKGEMDKAKIMDSYVTFLAGILRSVRFGAATRTARPTCCASTISPTPGRSPAMPRAVTASTSTRCARR
jgi:hypothetical protein